MSWEPYLERWVDARLIDPHTAEQIRGFENSSDKKRLRWPAILAISFGALMLCAGILLFVAAHWDDLTPLQRFMIVLGMVAGLHVAASFLGEKVPTIGVALHAAGTVSLGAGIYLGGQIFNLQEHWPGGVLLWSVGAAVAWLLLRQWPQALLVAMLVPWWLAGEWTLTTSDNRHGWNIAAQGLLLLSILYLTTEPKKSNRRLRSGLIWIGALALIPFILDVIITSLSDWGWSRNDATLPVSTMIVGYAGAYLPVLLLAWVTRKGKAVFMLAAAAWVCILPMLSHHRLEENLLLYLWVALGACAFCYWGVQENRKLLINYGTVIFAIDLIAFYFSSVLDKLGRSMGLILLGVIFLAGGWVLNRLRTDLIARAAAAGVKE